MSSFKGKYEHKISDTGRISIPSKFRDILRAKYDSDDLVFLSFKTHLRVYPYAEWKKQEEAWEQEKPTPEMNKFLRQLYSMMDECSLDKNGRIVINPDIRKYNSLEGDCVINGFRNHMEIWSKEEWDRTNNIEDVEALLGKFADSF